MCRHRIFTGLLPLALAIQIGTVAAETLLPNGSFETGSFAPAGWRLRATGEWVASEARTGKCSLTGRSRKGEVSLESETIALQPQKDYRLEGWVRCREGQARLSLELLNEAGDLIKREETPPVQRAAAWQRIALVPPAPPAQAATVRMVAVARGGKVWFDDFDLVGLRPNQPPSSSFTSGRELLVALHFFGSAEGGVHEASSPCQQALISVNLFSPDNFSRQKLAGC